MKDVLIKFTNGGSMRMLCFELQIQGLNNGTGIQTDMYGFIPQSYISWFQIMS